MFKIGLYQADMPHCFRLRKIPGSKCECNLGSILLGLRALKIAFSFPYFLLATFEALHHRKTRRNGLGWPPVGSCLLYSARGPSFSCASQESFCLHKKLSELSVLGPADWGIRDQHQNPTRELYF